LVSQHVALDVGVGRFSIPASPIFNAAEIHSFQKIKVLARLDKTPSTHYSGQ
jgi:hypothetical protein